MTDILFTLHLRMTTDELAVIREPGEDVGANVADLLASDAVTVIGYECEPLPGVRIIGGDGHELEERAVGAWSAEAVE